MTTLCNKAVQCNSRQVITLFECTGQKRVSLVYFIVLTVCICLPDTLNVFQLSLFVSLSSGSSGEAGSCRQ